MTRTGFELLKTMLILILTEKLVEGPGRVCRLGGGHLETQASDHSGTGAEEVGPTLHFDPVNLTLIVVDARA